MIELGRSAAWLPEVCVVTDVCRENKSTVTLELENSSSEPHSQPLAGQFHMLYAFGVGEIPVSFSRIESDKVAHTVREVGAVSKAIAALKPGASLGVRGPFGNSWSVSAKEHKHIVLIAGGLGLAPLRPLIERLWQESRKYEQILLLIGSRDPQSMLFTDDVTRWRTRIEVRRSVDSCQFRNRGDDWNESVGFVHTLLDRESELSKDTAAFICGPEIMMRHCAERLVELGVNSRQISLSLERNMKCGIGLCGHCQFGPDFLCKQGPIGNYHNLRPRLRIREF